MKRTRDLIRGLCVLGALCAVEQGPLHGTAHANGTGYPIDRLVRPEGAPRFTDEREKLESLGEQLFARHSLSGNGLACASCHAALNFYNDSFLSAYPHRVNMPYQVAGLDEVNAETMVQFCLAMPMGTAPLPWQSRELAALAAFVEKTQREYAAANQ